MTARLIRVALVPAALLAALAREPAASRLVIDLRKVGRIDYTGAFTIKRIAQDAEAGGLTVHILPGQLPQGPQLLERVLGAESPWLKPPPQGPAHGS